MTAQNQSTLDSLTEDATRDKDNQFTHLSNTSLDIVIGTSLLLAGAGFAGPAAPMPESTLKHIYQLIGFSCFSIGVLMLLICKRRVTDKIKIPFKERLLKLCHRCVGITFGALILAFPVTIASISWVPVLDNHWRMV